MLNRNAFAAFAIILLCLVLCVLSVRLSEAPELSSKNLNISDFSANRALTCVRNIARKPHSMGTQEHMAVRSYLLKELHDLQVETQVQQATVSLNNKTDSSNKIGNVYNIIGRIKGYNNNKAVLLVAHYDSMPNSLGAADDGSGVASLLETARALKKCPQLENDVVILMTDGEEYGSLGAKAFLMHPFFKNMGFVINVEARGSAGASFTFELSSQNGWVVKEANKSGANLITSSAFYEIYKKLPNYTDFSVFKSTGLAGVNSAFIGGLVNYHKLTDSYDNLDIRSVQLQGANLLALTRHFGNLSLANTKGNDRVFFNPAGRWLVQYPSICSFIFFMILTALLIVHAWCQIKSGQQKKLDLVKGALFSIVAITLTLLALFALNEGVGLLLDIHKPYDGVYGRYYFLTAYLLFSLSVFCILLNYARNFIQVDIFFTGGYLLIYLVVLVQIFLIPSTSYLFTFPLAFCLFALLLVRLFSWNNVTNLLILLIGLLPAIFMLMPLTIFLFDAFELQNPLYAISIFLVFIAMSLPMFHLTFITMEFVKIKYCLGVAISCFLVLITYSIFVNKSDTAHPIKGQVSFYQNCDSGKAFWITGTSHTLNVWEHQFFIKPSLGVLDDIYPYASVRFLKNESVALTEPAPVARIVGGTSDSAHKTLLIELSSPRGAANLDIVILPGTQNSISNLSLNGERLSLNYIESKQGPAIPVQFYGLPIQKKIYLTIELRNKGRIKLILIDKSIGLPAEMAKIRRSGSVIPDAGIRNNITALKKSYFF